jgi:hypothetical protein
LRSLGFGAPFLYRRLHLLPIAMSSVPEGEIRQLIQSRTSARLLDIETQTASGFMNAGLRSNTYYVTR